MKAMRSFEQGKFSCFGMVSCKGNSRDARQCRGAHIKETGHLFREGKCQTIQEQRGAEQTAHQGGIHLFQ
jgi:hypothetical protein